MTTKPCVRCHRVLPLTAFYRYSQPNVGDGYMRLCKRCHVQRCSVRGRVELLRMGVKP